MWFRGRNHELGGTSDEQEASSIRVVIPCQGGTGVSVTSVDVLRKGWRLGDDVGCRVCVGRDRDGSHFG